MKQRIHKLSILAVVSLDGLFVRGVNAEVKAPNIDKLAENSVLIVLDENGAGMPGGKWTIYDWGVRSACIMKWPGSYGASSESAALAQYCDILSAAKS